MPQPPTWRTTAAALLTIQSIAAILWWLLLWTIPASRAYFRPVATPDSALLAFFLPDTVLFIGAALWAARDLRQHKPAGLSLGGSLRAARCATLLISLYFAG